MARLIAPRVVGAAAFHVNLVVITALASTLVVGSITILSVANNLYFLPIGVIGVSFATAAFPFLAKAAATKDREGFKEQFLLAVRSIFFFIIPISSFMFLLREHIVQLFFAVAGRFGSLDITITGAVFGAFALGVFFQSLVPLFARAFYALKDTKTPTIIGITAIGVNVTIALVLLWLLSFPNFIQSSLASFFNIADLEDIRVVALPLAVSVSIALQGFLLGLLLKFKLGVNMKKVSVGLNKIGVSGIIMGIASFFALKGALVLFPLDTFWHVLFQASIAVAIGLTAYLAAAKLLKVEELKLLPFFKKEKIVCNA